MIETTEYYDDFLRYFHKAKEQQVKCNVATCEPYGLVPHMESNMDDDLLIYTDPSIPDDPVTRILKFLCLKLCVSLLSLPIAKAFQSLNFFNILRIALPKIS